MQIIGCDLHARQQTIAMLDTDTGELEEKTLGHEGETVREFYSAARLVRREGRGKSLLITVAPPAKPTPQCLRSNTQPSKVVVEFPRFFDPLSWEAVMEELFREALSLIEDDVNWLRDAAQHCEDLASKLREEEKPKWRLVAAVYHERADVHKRLAEKMRQQKRS
jgi:hypothetical protein